MLILQFLSWIPTESKSCHQVWFSFAFNQFGVMSHLHSPGDWLQEAGGAVQRGRLAGSQLTSNRRTRTLLHLGLVQCMDASLRRHHQCELKDQSATTFGIDRIKRLSPPRTLEPDLNYLTTTPITSK
jgi:hypothetical protein